MPFRFWLPSILLIYYCNVDKHVCAVITEKEGLRGPEIINAKGNVMMRETKASDGVNSDLQNHDSDMMTRMNNMEKNINELMKSVNDILQMNTKIQNNLINVKEELDSRIGHANEQLNDYLNGKFEELENKLNMCDESVVNVSHRILRRDMNPSTLEEKVLNVERATSLLAISKIKLADLTYMIHCDSNIEDGAESHMDACLQARVAELYNDFNEVLDFHVMLVDGAGPHEGRVEIVYRGQHGTICDIFWNNYKNTNVLCKMLGYEAGGYPLMGSHFGDGTGEILLDKVECTGEEGSLLGCKHRGISGYDDVSSHCHHGRDAGVRCYT